MNPGAKISSLYWPGIVLGRLVWLGLTWWALAEGAWEEWFLVSLSILGALLASLILFPPAIWNWRLSALFRFVPYFIWQCFLGGIDVSQRAFHPALPLRPGFLEFPMRLPLGPAAVFFAWTISLLPGSASVELSGTTLRVHSLDMQMPLEPRLRELETRVAFVFGHELHERSLNSSH